MTDFYKRLEFQQRLMPIDGEAQLIIYLVGNWHKHIAIAPELLSAGSKEVWVNQDGMVEFKVANGRAIYKLSTKQLSKQGMAFERVSYEQTEKI